MAKLIRLTRGQVAIVDDEDYEFVSQFKWFAFFKGKTCYAYRSLRRPDGRYTTQAMHALIMNTPKGMETHHWNENGCDNRKENMAVLDRVSHRRLGAKSGPKPGTPTPPRPPRFPAQDFFIYPYFYGNKPLRYRAFIKVAGALKHHGYFDTYWEADTACRNRLPKLIAETETDCRN